MRGFGHWPPHLIVPRLLRHSQIDSQLERLIPFLIFSVGNVQCHLSKYSHRKFRLNGKRHCFSSFSRRNAGLQSRAAVVLQSFHCLFRLLCLYVVFPCGRVRSGIIKVILSFFRKGEEVAIVPVDIIKHQGVLE